MARLNLRFRKSIPIIPKVLYWNITKTGMSISLRLGPLNKTWGTKGNTTSIDAPGTLGFSWRKDERKKKSGKKEKSEQEHGLPWNTLCLLLLLEGTVYGILLYIKPFLNDECYLSGDPWPGILFLFVAQAALIATKVSRISLLALLVLSGVMAYILWLGPMVSCG